MESPVIVYWHWWILALLLATLEVFAPGVFFIWLGMAALVVGGVLLLLPGLGWEGQLILFSLLSVIALMASRLYLRRRPLESDQPLLNRRGEAHIGKLFTLVEPLTDGRGAIRVADSRWRVESDGADLPVGARVRVVAVDGALFRVEPADTVPTAVAAEEKAGSHAAD